MTPDTHDNRWMRSALIAAGLYNLVWGTLVILLPNQTLTWLGVTPLPRYPQFWQCIGMVVGVYGVGYLLASRDPFRHWPVILTGLLGKILGPAGFAIAVISGALPLSMLWTIVPNDLIWWVPFSSMLWKTLRHEQSAGSAYLMPATDAALREMRTNTGETLDYLADQNPQMVVFLRHTGCTFCRESLADLAEQRAQIESQGCGIVLVHMGDNEQDAAFFEQYSLDDLPRISDPECHLYRLFGLDLGSFTELLSPRVWLRGFFAAIVGGHGVGRLNGNGFQMPGIYLYHCGQILGGFQHARASDRPDYAEIACRIPVSRSAAAV